MLNTLRRSLAKVLLKREYKQLNDLRDMYAAQINKEVDPAKAYRAQMKGFDVRTLDSEDDLEVLYDTEDGLDSFLADVQALANNQALHEILKILKRNQMRYIALETQNIDQVNFGRATVNGFMLLEEEIGRLVAIHSQRTQKEEEYDPSELI